MEQLASNVIKVSPFDTEELVRLRIAQYSRLASTEVVLLSSPLANLLEFITLYDYIDKVKIEEEEKDESEPIIVRVWHLVHAKIPDLPKINFAILWYRNYSPATESSRTSMSRDEPLLLTIRSLYRETEDNNGPFATLKSLQDSLEEYEEDMTRRAKSEIDKLRQDNSVVSQLAGVTPVKSSRIDYTGVNTIIQIEDNDDPEGLYNDIVCDQVVPLAVYNGSIVDREDNIIARRELYKLYKGVGLEATPPIEQEWLISTPGAITFRVFTGNNISTAKANDYTIATYDWKKQQLAMKIPIQRRINQDDVVEKLLSRLPLVPSERRNTDIEGIVKIRDFAFRDSLLAEMVMNDTIFRRYLSIRETSLLAMTNRRPTYRMGDPGSDQYLEFRIENRESKINESFLLPENGELYMEERTPYAALIITASSSASIETFMRIIPYLLARYQEQEEALVEEYRKVIPSYGSIALSEMASPAPIDTAIKALENIAPEIFTDNYARSCQSPHQPIILDPEREADWNSETFVFRGQPVNRQTMHFPAKGEAPTRIFGCPNPAIPFVGLVGNTRGNRELFPYLPCCFTDDETNTTGNYYGVYFRGETPAEPAERTRSTNVIDTNKFATHGQYGTLPRNINFLLRMGTLGTWYRAGTVLSPNSAIHSLAIIPGFGEEYPLYADSEKREEYVVNSLRPAIVSSIYPELLKQELPDVSLSQIKEQLESSSVLFDTRYYFRVLEEAYKINLVVFTLNENDRLGGIEVPTSKGLSYRPYLNPERPTVMLYKHQGVEANVNDFPQWELIVRHDSTTNTNSYFAEPELVDVLNDAMVASCQGRTWSFDQSQGSMIIDHQASVVIDLGIVLDIEKIKGQYIDDNGKLRFVLYEDMTITTPLLPPVNAPSVASKDVQLVPINRVFTFIEEMRAKGFDALVYAMNTDITEAVVGVWWYLGGPTPKTLFFIPTLPSPLLPVYNQVHLNYLPYPAIFSSGDFTRNYYDYLSRVKYILLEALQYLFVFNLQLPVSYTIKEFINEYTTVIEEHEYQVTDIDRYFPRSDTLDEAILELETTIPSFVIGRKLILNSQKLQDRLLSYLQVFYGQIEGRVPELPSVMKNFFQSTADFTQQPGQIIFDSYSRAVDWVQRFQQQAITSVVTTIITDDYADLIDPYILSTPQGYFLIQNVLDGNRERALYVSQEWVKGVNIGFNAPAEGNGSAVVYQVGQNGIPDRRTGSGSDYLLRYPKGYYAAMLYLSQ